MKPSWNKKYTTIAIYCAIVLLFAIFSVFFFINYGKFDEYIEAIWKAIRSIIYGAIIAYLLWPVLKFFENKVFAFLTGDDKIPTIPEKPEIPTVPEIPEKPNRPVFDKSVSVIEKQRILLEYDEQMREYKRQMREYKRLLAAKKHAESTIAKIEKRTPKLEIKIAKVTARHERIRSRCYNDGAKRTRFGLRRALSVLMTVIVMIILIALFIYMVVPQTHPLAKHEGIRLKDLEGQSILLFSQIGFWYELCKEKIPHPRFIMQDDFHTFGELAYASALPVFTTDYWIGRDEYVSDGRILLPILDPEANVSYYLACAGKDKRRFKALFEQIDS